mgnify:CR=1 FL=1
MKVDLAEGRRLLDAHLTAERTLDQADAWWDWCDDNAEAMLTLLEQARGVLTEAEEWYERAVESELAIPTWVFDAEELRGALTATDTGKAATTHSYISQEQRDAIYIDPTLGNADKETDVL